MSFNPAIIAAGAHLATQLGASHSSFAGEEPGCGTQVPGFHPPRPHALEALTRGGASFDEEGPWCGTKVPGFHPPLPHPLQSTLNTSALDKVALNPQPLPPKEAGLSASAGHVMDDEQCGTVPRQVFHWPPPPLPWTNSVSVALHPDVNGLVNGAVGRQT